MPFVTTIIPMFSIKFISKYYLFFYETHQRPTSPDNNHVHAIKFLMSPDKFVFLEVAGL